ncbi:pyrroline-5-carboxylate reductase 3-like [Macrosteles quadrilineatus]|uniref:pyrroline-5-carboxylate reductase 3-like n=1 Tax=Macrosteles quadrilineatus TaxID=74068 RepID=UPI0023E2FC6A|nr:pyrroline-5-carboxylate reductase 3-like [Macrosteles quadrilineatus]
MIECKIGFIGAGNMTKAIVSGMLDSGIVKPNLIIVSAPSKTNFPFWQEKGIATTHSNAEVVNKCDVIMLGIKPQYLDEAIKSFDPVPNNKLYISILVGITIETLNDKLRTQFRFTEAGPEPWRIVRVIPNTPIMVGAGATAYAVSEGARAEDSELVKTIFSAGGLCEIVPERLLNPVGALAGSGPAYVYLMIEALSDGAVKMGVPRALATQLASQTLLGAAKMVQTTGKHPGQLKDEVCSPGGTTITGIHVLERSGVRAALIGAVEAATNRSFELGNK